MPSIEHIEIAARGLRFPALSCGTGGPLVLLQHGFPDLPETFEGTLIALADAGYRAVAPTLRGYATSCLGAAPDANVMSAAHDLNAFPGALGEERAFLVGHDWGALAGYLAATLEPDRWRSLVTIAVPHPRRMPAAIQAVPRQIARSWYQVFFSLPVVPEAWFALNTAHVVDWAWRTWSPGFVAPPAHLGRITERLGDPAIHAAALAYYRALLRPGPQVAELGRVFARPLRVPTLTLHGERDGCMDARLYEHCMGPGIRASVESFQDAGHFLQLEQPGRFHSRLLDWLAEPTGGES